MKNIVKYSFLGFFLLCSSLTLAATDTLKVMKNNGEIVTIAVNAKNLNEVKSFDLQKMIESLSESDTEEVLLQGEKSNYMLSLNQGIFYIEESERKAIKQKEKFVFRIYENTSESELEALVEKAEAKNIDVNVKNLQIINGKIKAISIAVDCNDGFSGTASNTQIPESGFGFVRNYAEGEEVPFALGNVFRDEKTAEQSQSMDEDDEDDSDWMDGFITEFNEEKTISDNKDKKLIRYDHEVDFSIGLNGYVMPNGRFPEYSNEDYSLHQITSWTYQIHSSNRIKVGDYFMLNTRAGFRWNNFALNNESLQIFDGANEVEFIDRTDVEGTRSKLNVTYINLEAIPIFKFGKSSDAFRIGAGVYGGYRIGSKSKFKYEDDGKDVDRNNFYLNNWNYGVKAQVGWAGLDIFASYDLSPLFIENAGPELNAFSFGIIF